MQNNTLYCSKVLFCIELYTRDNNNKENKKVSEETKRYTYSVDLPMKMKKKIQGLALERDLTQKEMTLEIFGFYAANYSNPENDKKIQSILDDVKLMIPIKDYSLTDNDKLEIKKLVTRAYNMAKEKSDFELNRYKEFNQAYIKDLEDTENIDEFDKFAKQLQKTTDQ
jgi:hypothetical protein